MREINKPETDERLQKLLQHPLFQSGLKQLEDEEAERQFCRHGLPHLLDTARIAYILALEEKSSLSRDVIYAAAYLHDLGRCGAGVTRQTESGPEAVPAGHEEAGAGLAAVILPECGFRADETGQIAEAIRQHRSTAEARTELAVLLRLADKASRLCFACPASRDCRWPEDRKNKLPVR